MNWQHITHTRRFWYLEGRRLRRGWKAGCLCGWSEKASDQANALARTRNHHMQTFQDPGEGEVYVNN